MTVNGVTKVSGKVTFKGIGDGSPRTSTTTTEAPTTVTTTTEGSSTVVTTENTATTEEKLELPNTGTTNYNLLVVTASVLLVGAYANVRKEVNNRIKSS